MSKLEDVGANLGVMVAEKGFVEGARNIADRHGVKLYTLRDTRSPDWPNKIPVKFFVESVVFYVDYFVPADFNRKPLGPEEGPFRLFSMARP